MKDAMKEKKSSFSNERPEGFLRRFPSSLIPSIAFGSMPFWLILLLLLLQLPKTMVMFSLRRQPLVSKTVLT